MNSSYHILKYFLPLSIDNCENYSFSHTHTHIYFDINTIIDQGIKKYIKLLSIPILIKYYNKLNSFLETICFNFVVKEEDRSLVD